MSRASIGHDHHPARRTTYTYYDYDSTYYGHTYSRWPFSYSTHLATRSSRRSQRSAAARTCAPRASSIAWPTSAHYLLTALSMTTHSTLTPTRQVFHGVANFCMLVFDATSVGSFEVSKREASAWRVVPSPPPSLSCVEAHFLIYSLPSSLCLLGHRGAADRIPRGQPAVRRGPAARRRQHGVHDR